MCDSRDCLVTEARSWIGTPYHLGACLKGSGVDCAQFIYGVFHNCGLVPKESIGVFQQDWWHHAKQENYLGRVQYLLGLRRHAYKTADAIAYPRIDAEPGCILLLRAAGSKLYNHAGICVRWPLIIHAIQPCVEQIDASRHPMWEHQPIKILDPFAEGIPS